MISMSKKNPKHIHDIDFEDFIEEVGVPMLQ